MPAHRTVTKVCETCGGRVRVNSAKYCSMECYRTGDAKRRRSVIEQWLSGDVSVVTTSQGELSYAARQYLRSEAENKCSRCGWGEANPVDGVVPVQIDHVDGNPHNHLRENLVVLCPNCHSLTPTYGMKNRGNGRKTRHV